MAKNLPATGGNARRMGSIPGLKRSCGEGNGNPLWYLAQEIPWRDEPGGCPWCCKNLDETEHAQLS